MVLAFISLILIVVVTAYWLKLAGQVNLPDNRGPYVAAWIAGVLLGVTALIMGSGWIGGIAATLAILVGSMLTYFFAISAQRVGPDAIAVGEPLRDFTAVDMHGNPFQLSSISGKPLLIKFFRGHW